MRHLVEFMNHGILPFTGREEEVARLVSFWRVTSEGNNLRTMLLLGEAGTGKSRLLEEVVDQVARSNGAVVHIKLFPESATSIVPLVARGLWRFAQSHPHLSIDAEETPSSVVAALRRLIHLRRTLLVFEDIHLLGGSMDSGVGGGRQHGGDAISTFGSILDSLADEQVAVLCMARPVELAVKSVLERHLVDEIELPRLGAEQISSLWERLLGAEPTPEVTEIVLEATAGNPLAIRSALRGAIKTGAVVGQGGDRGGVTVDNERFREVILRSVELLSEGMAAHLTDDERRGASRIASLGEIVARESALQAVDNDARLLEVLAFKGVLVEGGLLVEPLPTTASAHPLLSFTHSLLHRRLIGTGSMRPSELVELVAHNLPIYSVVPFHLLLDGDDPSGMSTELVRQAVLRGAAICPFLNRSNDWELGEIVRRACSRLLEINAHAFDADELRRLRAVLVNAQLFLLWRGDYDETFEQLVGELDLLTRDAHGAMMLEHRLLLCLHRTRLLRRRDYDACTAVWHEANELVTRHAGLVTTMSWIQFLVEAAASARTTSDVVRLRAVESRYRELAGSDLPAETRHAARHAIFPYVADLFETPQEANERLATIDELMREQKSDDRLFAMKALLRYSMGWVDEAADVVTRELLPRFTASGLLYNVFQSRFVLLQVESAHGLPLGDVLTRGRAIVDEAPAGVRILLRQTAGIHLPYEGLLRGDAVWADTVYGEFLGHQEGTSSPLRFLIDLALGDHASALRCDVSVHVRPAMLQQVLRTIEQASSLDDAVAAGKALLAEPLLRTTDVAVRRAAFGLLMPVPDDGLQREIRARLEETMQWLLERSLDRYMASMLETFSGLFAAKGERGWRTEIARIGRARERSSIRAIDTGRLRVSMLGAIAVRTADGVVVSPRGIRVKTLLGLMVADRMLATPLTHREFCRLIAPDAAEFEDARKTLNLTVHRLRESIGHETILTDSDTPRLDPDMVDVDLLSAHVALQTAAQGVRDGSYPLAFSGLMEALERVGGNVPFPSLYDDFFEAAREDFENRLRSLVLTVARGLVREGDAASAAQILERASSAMHGDDEVALVLADTLTLLGRRAEAERRKMEVAD